MKKFTKKVGRKAKKMLTPTRSSTPIPQLPPQAVPVPAADTTPAEISKFVSPAPTLPSKAGSSHSQGLSSMAETSWNGFKIALGTLKEVSVVFPPLQAAVGGLLKVIDVADQVSTNQENLEFMNQQIRRLCQILQPYEGSPVPDHVRGTVEAHSQSIERRKTYIQERIKRGLVGRVLNASTDAAEIINSLRELSFAVDLFQMNTLITVEVQTRETNEVRDILHLLNIAQLLKHVVKYIQKHKLFEVLNAVPGARFDESTRNGCMDGTRVDTLAKLFSWAADRTSQPILWLSGMAGIGKSAIAHSFCQKVLASNRLGASFFCSRQSENLSNVSRILPTIAYQLAFQSQAYRDALIKVLGQTSQSSYGSATLQKQAQDLFIDLKDHLSIVDPLIVVIDALDECSRPTDVSDLLRVVLRSGLPIKFLITSRPETHIDRGFSTEKRFKIDLVLAKSRGFLSELLSHASLHLHDAEADVVEEDILRYLKTELFLIMENIDEGTAEHQLRALAKKSGNLFIFAFTAVQYISDSKLSLSQARGRLSIMLGTSLDPPTKLSTQVIDGLYRQIFEAAYDEKENFEISAMHAALETLLCLRVPQSISVISTLLKSKQDDVRAGLENFSSVLNIPKTDDKPIFVFHASFPDYVLDAHRSGLYTLVKYNRHLHLTTACLELMNEMLQENICSIPKRQTLNANIDKSVIQQIPSVLQYASVYWAPHLDAGAHTEDVGQLVILLNDFVNIHLLHWLECLSLLEELHVAYSCLQKAQMFLMQHEQKMAQFKQVQTLLLDAQYMIPQVYYFVKQHALEIYTSALMWLPSDSVLRAQYMQVQPHQVLLGLEHQWSSSLQVLQTHGSVHCITFSPHGFYVACGSKNWVQIWSLETGECMQLEGHTESVNSVAFSPDGSKLASGSYDKTVHIWNTKTGEAMYKLMGHTETVYSVAFLSDGLRLASGSYNTMQIWNANTGEAVHKWTGQINFSFAAAFSHDGSKLASSSGHKAMHIWNSNTGEVIHKLTSHTDFILSVAFSPDGFKLASGSLSEIVQIWDINTGEATHRLIGHSGTTTSLVFSHDGLRLASGSFSKTVQIWNINTGEAIQELIGHTDGIHSLAFSKDGSILASGTDNAIRIWNPNVREAIYKSPSYTDFTNSAIYSHDGSKLASSSIDTVQIWDVYTGESIHTLVSQTDIAHVIAFSHDGSRLAAGLDDNTVQIWNINTGEAVHKLIGHERSNMILSIAFSPDGLKLASGSTDETVKIWNTNTGETIHRLIGHSYIASVVFSHDGLRLASGSYNTVHIWNASTGEAIYLLRGHVGNVCSITFSYDGSKLAAGSDDKTVHIWNANSGELIQKLTSYIHPNFVLSELSESSTYNKTIVVTDADDTSTLQHGPQSLLMAIYQPVGGQYAVVMQNAKLEMEPLFWIWGSNIQPEHIGDTVAYVGGKICIGYRTGKVVIVRLPI